MIIFKSVDQFDRNTGEKTQSMRVPDFEICDFTGKRIDKGMEPIRYRVDYGSTDPCFGCHNAEDWAHELDLDASELFGQTEYVFFTEWSKGREPFQEMLEAFQEYHKETLNPYPYSLEHILRWSRGRMLEKVIKSGEYKIEDFLEDEWI